jgi:hypothetical protein
MNKVENTNHLSSFAYRGSVRGIKSWIRAEDVIKSEHANRSRCVEDVRKWVSSDSRLQSP